jgi:hypothetical protein
MKLFDNIKATLGMGDNVTGPASDAPAQGQTGGRRRTHRRRRGRKCRGGSPIEDAAMGAVVGVGVGGGRRRRRGSRKSRRGSRKHTRRHRR